MLSSGGGEKGRLQVTRYRLQGTGCKVHALYLIPLYLIPYTLRPMPYTSSPYLLHSHRFSFILPAAKLLAPKVSSTMLKELEGISIAAISGDKVP